MTGPEDPTTTGRRGRDDHDTDALSGAYVLNALTDDERRAFEARLAGSDDLTEEVTGLTETTLLMAHALEPVTPSASVRAGLMAAIASTPQLPRLDESTSTSTSTSEHRATTAEPARVPTPEVEAAESERAGGTVLAPTGAARARWFTRPVGILAASAAAAALFFGGGAVIGQLTAPAQQEQQQASGIEEIYAAEDFQRAVTDVSTGGTAALVWSNELQRSAVVVDGLTSLPGDQTYELWYINESGAAPAGTFGVSSSSPVTQVLDGTMQQGDTIGITIEPQGGSESPTTDPIAVIQSA